MSVRIHGISTCTADHRPRRQEQEINNCLDPNILTHIIHHFNQRYICLDKRVLALRVDDLQLRDDAICGYLLAANEIYSWLAGILRELFQSCLADAAGCTNEDGDKSRRKRGDLSVGGLDAFGGNHNVVVRVRRK